MIVIEKEEEWRGQSSWMYMKPLRSPGEMHAQALFYKRLSPNHQNCFGAFPSNCKIHYLLFYCIYLQVHVDPLGGPVRASEL